MYLPPDLLVIGCKIDYINERKHQGYIRDYCQISVATRCFVKYPWLLVIVNQLRRDCPVPVADVPQPWLMALVTGTGVKYLKTMVTRHLGHGYEKSATDIRYRSPSYSITSICKHNH